jgi:hypothetical protein
VTPHVTNSQGSNKHMSANTKKLKAIRNPIGKIEKLKLCHRCPDAPIQEIWKFYETESGVAPKREFHDTIILYHSANPQKISRSGSIGL